MVASIVFNSEYFSCPCTDRCCSGELVPWVVLSTIYCPRSTVLLIVPKSSIVSSHRLRSALVHLPKKKVVEMEKAISKTPRHTTRHQWQGEAHTSVTQTRTRPRKEREKKQSRVTRHSKKQSRTPGTLTKTSRSAAEVKRIC